MSTVTADGMCRVFVAAAGPGSNTYSGSAARRCPVVSKENGKPRGRWEVSGIFVPACAAIGMGIGSAFGHLSVGLFIGVGVGFLLMGIVGLFVQR